MKGLLRNNFYATLSNIKFFSIVMALTGVFVIAVISQPLLFGYTILSMVGYSFLSISSFHKENNSKWCKYKLVSPVQRIDIIKSYFFSQLIWIAVGMTAALVVIGLSCLLHGCPFDKNIDFINLVVLGLSISLFMSAFFFPLRYIGDSEKSEASLFISLLCSVGIVLGLISFTNWLFDKPMTEIGQLIGITLLAIFSILCFFISIPLTAFIFKRKEF